MSTAADEEILRFALAKNAVVVTPVGPSVIRIRIQGLGATEFVELVRFVSIRFDSELKAGSLVTIKPRKTTCHRLPIGHSQ